MKALLLLPLILQAIAIIVDEFYFHHRRRLGRWEIIGHPLDTATVLAGYVFLFLATPSTGNLVIFGAIAAFSSLFVTKDEWVHAELCDPGEHWLHAVLFTLHPLAFLAAGWIWFHDSDAPLIKMQAAVLFLFLSYQIIYWGILANEKSTPGRQ